MIEIDLEARTLNVRLTDAEIQPRLALLPPFQVTYAEQMAAPLRTLCHQRRHRRGAAELIELRRSI